MHPKDYAKAVLVLSSLPHEAKASAKKFHATNAAGLYNDIFLKSTHSEKSVLYTWLVLGQCKALCKSLVEGGEPAFLNQAVTNLTSMFLTYIHTICDEDDEVWIETLEGYFDGLSWDDGTQGHKINDLRCDKFDYWLTNFWNSWQSLMESDVTSATSANAYFNSSDSYTKSKACLDILISNKKPANANWW